MVFTAAVCDLLITLDFREPAGRRLSRCSSAAQTQVSRHASAAVTMLVNGLTRLWATNDSSTEHGAVTLCRRVAVYSGPFRCHEMTGFEIIIAFLHCRTVGVLACMHSCTMSSDIWTPWYRRLEESVINIAIACNWYDPCTPWELFFCPSRCNYRLLRRRHDSGLKCRPEQLEGWLTSRLPEQQEHPLVIPVRSEVIWVYSTG